jgi:hypothetical protein
MSINSGGIMDTASCLETLPTVALQQGSFETS